MGLIGIFYSYNTSKNEVRLNDTSLKNTLQILGIAMYDVAFITL